ncbi:tyrosine-type recombinase/integrase [Nisaea sp.]|uniref:tyrosine-type recombinase/integrase n=1 Tax=Nisaea sp. TaxID=2024842 RepID=UPI0032EB6E25
MKLSPIPVHNWHPVDRELWTRAQKKASKLDDPGWAAHLRPATIGLAERGYGLWNSWLINRNLLSNGASPKNLITKKDVLRFAEEFCKGRSGNTVHLALRGIHTVVRAMEETRDYGWLDHIARHYAATPKTRNKAARLVPIDALFAFGQELIDKNRGPLPLTSFAAYEFRDGLMISFLAAHPDRRHNFQDLRLGDTLVQDKVGYLVQHDGAQMKNHKARSYRVIDSLTPHLDLYFSRVRPVLMKNTKIEADTGHVWLSQYGKPMSPASISSRISDLTKSKFGKAIPPHFFRDCAATSIALEDPGHVWITKEVLGHSSIATSQKVYNQACNLSASRRFTTSTTALRALLKQDVID